jgi:hypothetical protein
MSRTLFRFLVFLWISLSAVIPRVLAAVQVNVTVDDSDASITYTGGMSTVSPSFIFSY